MKVPITEESEQTNQDTAPPSQPPVRKRRSHPLIVATLTILIVILAGSAAILGYAYYFQRPTLPPASSGSTTSSKMTTDNVLAAIKPVFNGSPTDKPALSLPIKVAGYNYYTQVDQARVKGLHGSVPYTDSALATAKIAKVLKQKQFNESIIQAGSGDSEYIAHYTHSDVVCEVTATKTANNPTGDHEVAVACANMDDYSSTAAAQKPFYDVYPNKPSDQSTNILFIGHPVSSPSQTMGYQTASVTMGGVLEDGSPAMGGYTGLYYQTPDKTWHFFKSAQNDLQCNDYMGDDVKKAYLGTECKDSAGNVSHVTLS